LPKTQNAVLAVAGAIGLGILAGATIPTQMHGPLADDWRETYGIRPDHDAATFYVEPGPQDLTPVSDGYDEALGPPAWLSRKHDRQLSAPAVPPLPDYASEPEMASYEVDDPEAVPAISRQVDAPVVDTAPVLVQVPPPPLQTPALLATAH